MSTRDTLRRADPAHHLPLTTLDAQAEALLQSILATPAGRTSTAAPAATAPFRRIRPTRDWKPILVTAAVAILVATGTVVTIRAASTAGPSPATAATFSSRHALEDAVFAKLGEVATGDIPVREKSALTYTDNAPIDGEGIDTTGKDLFIAAACDGGGSIAIQETGRPDTTLNCDSRAAIGPIDLTTALPKNQQTANLNVVVTSGHPRYNATAMAFAPKTPSN
jgi:hypothetical protein